MHIFETRYFRLAMMAFAILVCGMVVLNVFTPLRLTTDSIRYLNIMELLQGNLGADSYAAVDFFPHGYPYVLFAFDSVSLLSSLTIVVLNIVSVVMAGLLLSRLFNVRNRSVFIIFLFLSFINIKHLTLPLSDQLFTWALLAACSYWVKFFEKGSRYLLPGVLLTLASIYLRTAGIVLPIGLLFFIVYKNRKRLFAGRIMRWAIAVAAIAVVAIVLAKLPELEKKVDYVRQLELDAMLSTPSSIIDRMNVHLQEMGECLVNIPVSQLGRILHVEGEWVRWAYILVGLWVLLRIIKVGIRLQVHKQLTTWVMLAYFLMIFVWPFYDTRFLIPAIPFILYLMFPFFHSARRPRKVLSISTASFVLFGMLSLVYSTALSLDNDIFLRYYGNSPEMTEAYRQYFDQQPLLGSIPQQTDTDPDRLLYLLYMYDK